jgi:hypothetical protein
MTLVGGWKTWVKKANISVVFPEYVKQEEMIALNIQFK